VPDVSFVDEAGAARQLAGWRGRAIVVTFIFTRCPLPDFCPLMDTHFAAVQRQVRDDERLRGRVQLLSVSFDPSHDTPAVLAAHAKKNGADPAVWNFVTGDREEIDAFAALFGVSVMREGTNPSDIVHNLRTAVIDGNGRLVKVFNGIQWESADLVAELRSAVGGR
jgi:protein SCO1/2